MRLDEGFVPAAAKSAEVTADVVSGFNGGEEVQHWWPKT